MDQFVLIEQDDNNLYIKILSSRYVAPYYGLNKDDHRYTFSLDDKKYFGCLTTDCQPFTQSTIYPYIVTIRFQFYKYVQDDDKLTKLQVYEWITKQVQTQVDYQVEQKVSEQVNDQLQYINDKITILQQRCMHLHHKVRNCLKRH